MAIYGQYETVTELGRHGSVTTCRARPADGGWELGFDDLGTDANFVVKAFHVRNAEDAGAEEVSRFTERVATQKRVAAAAGMRHWAAILESGTVRDDAYYARAFFPRTALALAEGGGTAGAVTGAVLFAVVDGTLQGLLELRTQQRRPHGNLKSSNILIRHASGGVGPDDVALTDPALEQDATIAGDVEDLYNLGEVIHELVLGERFRGQHTWPVPMTGHWAALGKHGPRWLALCNHLLSPRAAENWLRADDVRDEVAAMRPPRKRFRSRKLWAAVATLAVVGGLGWGEWARYTGQWRELCGAYDEWAGPLSARLSSAAPPAAIGRDPYLQERVVLALAEARNKGVEIDPRRIAGETERPAGALADSPPLSLSAIWKTERAWRVVRGVDEALAPARWEAVADLKRRRADYAARKWPRLEAYAASVAAAAPARGGGGGDGGGGGGGGRDWAEGLAAVVEGRERLAKLDAARAAARARREHLVARADAASSIRDRIGQYETPLRVSADSDAVLPTAPAVETLTLQLVEAERAAAAFDDAVPLLAEAAKRLRAYEFREWAGPAKHLEALIDRSRPGADLAGLSEALAAAKRTWEQVEAQWAQIEQRRRLLESSGDRVLATYRQFVVQARPGEQADLAGLLRTLEEVNRDPAWAAVAKRVEEPDWARFDVVTFAQKSEAHRGFAGKTVASTQDLRKWLSEVEGFGSQLASATMRPDPVTTAPTPPKPPTTVASVSPEVGPTATTKAAPPTVAANVNESDPAWVGAGANPGPKRPAPPSTMAAIDPPAATRPAAPPDAAVATGDKPPTTTGPSTTGPSATAVAINTPAADRPAPTRIVPEATTRTSPIEIAMVPPATTGPGVGPRPATTRTVGPTPTETVEVKPPVKPPVAASTEPLGPPAPGADVIARNREAAAFVTECRETGINAASVDVKEAWRAKNAEIAAAVRADPAVYSPALRAERDKMRGRLVRLDGAVRSASAPLAVKAPPGGAAWGGALVRALQGATPQWSGTLKELVNVAVAGDPKFDEALAGLVETDEQWRATAARLVADAGRVEQLLADGAAPGDKTPDGERVTAALAAVRGSDVYKYAEVQQALEPLLRPAAVVEAESGAAAMRLLAASADQPLGVRLAAWAKAAKQSNRETLDGDVKLAASLLEAAQAKLADKARADAIKARLETDVRARWLELMDGSASAQDVEAAIAMRDRITGIDVARLSPRAQFNLALAELRAAVGGEDAARRVGPAAEKLKKAATALDPALSRQTAVAAVAAEVDRVALQSGPPDFTKLGPLADSAGAKVAWSASAEDNGDKVTYRAALPTDAGKEDVSLVFRRVRVGGDSAAARSTWVCTTEVSLGVFSDLMTAAGKWPDVRAGKLLADYNPARGDPRVGPRTWEWPRYGRSPGAVRSLVWLSGDFVPPRVDHYPDTIGSEFNRSVIRDAQGGRAEELNPSRRMPMQHVSARAAALAASLAGCRLPTVAEWQAAYKSVEQHVGLNLRDRTWRLELEHMGKPVFGNRCRPDAGIFMPAGEKPSDEVWQRPGGGELNDGVLWFREVTPAAPVFVDLAGNVAEFVTDDAGKVHVIGGSAMSPPTRPLERPFEVGADQLSGGFADVGFRLAFGEPAVGIDKLREAVAGNWYLTAR